MIRGRENLTNCSWRGSI